MTIILSCVADLLAKAKVEIDPKGLKNSHVFDRVELEVITDIEEFIAQCLLETQVVKVAGAHRLQDWESGWAGSGYLESDDGFQNVPYYFKKNLYVRCGEAVYRDLSGYTELRLLRCLQEFSFGSYISKGIQFDAVCEYGCGTGHNITYLAKLFPQIQVWCGTDWAKSAVENLILKGVVDVENCGIVDYFRPETFWSPPVSFLAYTNASLEQSGDSYRDFMRYLLDDPLCVGGVHIEPIRELLSNSPLDRNSFSYAERRNYLTGFLEFMCSYPELSVSAQDYGIGSKYISGYQVLTWTKRD